MPKALIWMSFDFNAPWDYRQLYVWLDSHGAKECVNEMAVFHYEYENDLIETLKKDLSVFFSERARVYVIYHDSGKIKGKFIFGCRQKAPWVGFQQIPGPDDEDLNTD